MKMDSRLVAMLGNYSAAGPIVAKNDKMAFLFLDHRMPVSERVAEMNRMMAACGVETVERVVVDPPEVDCPRLHDWQPVVGAVGWAVAVQCRACRDMEILLPPLRYVEPVATSATAG